MSLPFSGNMKTLFASRPMKDVRTTPFLAPILLTLLVILMLLPLISYAVQGKTPVSTQQRAPKIVHIPQYVCNQTYSDITPSIEQKLLLAHNVSNLTLTEFPLKYTERYYLFRMSNPARTIHYMYLYDVGADELWLTADDRTFFITDEPLGNAFLAGTISETSTAINFYWSYLDTVYNLVGTYVYACTLSSQGCINQRTVTVSWPPYQINGLSVASSQNKLYMAIADASYIDNPGDIYSCSLSPLAPDYCSVGSSIYNWHANYTFLLSAHPETGFSYAPNTPLPVQFFDIIGQQSSSIPQEVILDHYMTAQINILFFTYRWYSSPSSRIDFVTMDTQGTISVLGTDTSRIRPLLTTLTNNTIYFVYSKNNPYRHIIKPLTGPETVIYVNTTFALAPLPFTLQKDHGVLGAYPWQTGFRIYLSNCRF